MTPYRQFTDLPTAANFVGTVLKVTGVLASCTP